ncbi:SAM-dependent methyltransferase [Actinomadura bangladeshensis]|uniref:SAM-dependent methyltransferase n=2 Tax=Actinomadura bangladeshensis TaxID=453573 RepID=A0A4R4NF28_9ACTN|nr:SAM-dependent methyltransferase [Actinomadura bangladeshensis]
MSGMAFDRLAAERDLHGRYGPDCAAMPRLWAFWGGGKDFNPADRALGETVAARFPQVETLALHRLAFRSRVVRALVGECGVDQLLVVGVDMPMHDEVHQVAHSVNPDARVVYADADALAMLYAEAMFRGRINTCGFVRAGLDDPRAVLDGAAATLDLRRPVAVLLINSLDVLTDPQAVEALAAFRAALAAGSYIGFCHLTAEYDHGLAALGSVCAETSPGPPRVRTPNALAAFCAGMVMIRPGLVSAPVWRPDPGPWPVTADVDLWCGVGVLP